MGGPDWQTTSRCRACGNEALLPVFDFGDMPLADRLEPRPDSTSPAPRAPLALLHCPACTLVQLSVSVSPAFLFDEHYPYYSSVSASLLAHFSDSAWRIISEYGIGPGSLVVEAASNDGYMLRHFKAAGADVLGFDPASGPANVAIKAGIDTHISFFDIEAAHELVAAGKQADIFLANNVLAHVPDLTGFAEAI
ncbi:methyltransferase, partial [Limnoraphis robusta CCNP1324]|nr:methyltransferase [Limnoraphis robusta CCNP1324]